MAAIYVAPLSEVVDRKVVDKVVVMAEELGNPLEAMLKQDIR